MSRVVYGLAILQAAVLLFFAGQYAFGPGTATSSGGAGMELLFPILLPLATLLLATAVFRFVRWRVLRLAAALVIMASPVVLAYWGVDDAVQRAGEDAARREYASGRGYFASPAAKALGEAIVRGDPAGVAAAACATDVNQTGESGQTFLGLAMTWAKVDDAIVRSLLEAGADPNQHDGWPLGFEVRRGSAPLATMLLDAGADPNQLNKFRRPALFGALDQPDMLAFLLPRGVRADAVDGNGWTALMLATWDGQWPAVALSLADGTDLGHVVPDGTGLFKAVAFQRYRARITEQPVSEGLLALEARMRDQGAYNGR